MLTAMDRRKHNEFATQASLHGVKIPMRHNVERLSEIEAQEPFDPEIEARVMREAFERIGRRHGR